MKAVVIGDTHFGGGYSVGLYNSQKQLNSRLIDFSNTFDFIIDYMITNCISNLFITGDIFESRRPHATELRLFSEKVKKLEKLNINTHIVVGNHDIIQDQSATTLDFLTRLELPNLKIYSEIQSFVIGDVGFIMLPFRNKQMLGCGSDIEAIKRLNNMIQFEKDNLNTKYKILIGHFMVQNTTIGNTVKDYDSQEIVLDLNMFDELDGVIMGHIHPHQIIQSEPLITYIGSMERNDFNDCGVTKFFLSIESGDDLIFTFERAPIREMFELNIDLSGCDNGQQVIEQSMEYLKDFSKNHNIRGSIMKIDILINEMSSYDFNSQVIKNFVKSNLHVFNCLSVTPQIVSKRLLRNASITESLSPKDSFIKYVQTIEDITLREKMLSIGLPIIESRIK